jgi:hypothetical protein
MPQGGFIISTLIVTGEKHCIKIYFHNEIISQREKEMSHNQATNNQAINGCN